MGTKRFFLLHQMKNRPWFRSLTTIQTVIQILFIPSLTATIISCFIFIFAVCDLAFIYNNDILSDHYPPDDCAEILCSCRFMSCHHNVLNGLMKVKTKLGFIHKKTYTTDREKNDKKREDMSWYFLFFIHI